MACGPNRTDYLFLYGLLAENQFYIIKIIFKNKEK